MKKVQSGASLIVLRCPTPLQVPELPCLPTHAVSFRRTHKGDPAMKALIDIDPTTAVGPRHPTIWGWGG
jgi:hypothetical protein